MKNIRIFLFTLLCALVFSSCSDTTSPDRDAVDMTLDKLRQSSGFEWFDSKYNAYTPDPTVIAQINAAMNSSDKYFLIFVNPSCACVGTMDIFPSTIKVLKSAGIDEPKFRIFSMITTADHQPYQNKFKVNQLPGIYIMRDSTLLYSVSDTLYRSLNPDPNLNYKVENYILNGLK